MENRWKRKYKTFSQYYMLYVLKKISVLLLNKSFILIQYWTSVLYYLMRSDVFDCISNFVYSLENLTRTFFHSLVAVIFKSKFFLQKNNTI